MIPLLIQLLLQFRPYYKWFGLAFCFDGIPPLRSNPLERNFTHLDLELLSITFSTKYTFRGLSPTSLLTLLHIITNHDFLAEFFLVGKEFVVMNQYILKCSTHLKKTSEKYSMSAFFEIVRNSHSLYTTSSFEMFIIRVIWLEEQSRGSSCPIFRIEKSCC